MLKPWKVSPNLRKFVVIGGVGASFAVFGAIVGTPVASVITGSALFGALVGFLSLQVTE